MKTRILIIALALVFVSGIVFAAPPGKMNDKDKGNNFWGKVYVPTITDAYFIDEGMLVCWDEGVADGYFKVAPSKFSVVVMFTMEFELDEACCEALIDCECPADGLVDIELDFSTEGWEGWYPEYLVDMGNGEWCLFIPTSDIMYSTEDYISDKCWSDCIINDGEPTDYPYVKVKGLNPNGKRQNNKFSETVQVGDDLD